MLNLEEEQIHFLNSTQSNPVENSRTSPLNLLMVGMAHHILTSWLQNRWTDKP